MTGLRAIELTDGGILLYEKAFLPSELADRYYIELRDKCVWEQKPGVFGHMQPRLTASYGDEGATYRYSGTVNVALPWTPTLLEIKEEIEAVHGRYNYCLLNRYRSGQDSMGMHADNEPEMGNVIGSLSLGATRTFRIKHNKTERENARGSAFPALLTDGVVGSRRANDTAWSHRSRVSGNCRLGDC